MNKDRKVGKNAGRNPAPAPAEKAFTAMTFREKLRFIGKAAVFFVSGGFIFPTMWID
jgi:hypothetical protein